MIDYLLLEGNKEKEVVTILKMELEQFSWQSVKMKNLETKTRLEIKHMTGYRDVKGRFMLMNKQ